LLNVFFKALFVSRKLFRVFAFACIRSTQSLPLMDPAVSKLKQSNFSNSRCAKSKASAVLDSNYSDTSEDTEQCFQTI